VFHSALTFISPVNMIISIGQRETDIWHITTTCRLVFIFNNKFNDRFNWLSNLSILSVPDEGYSRNVSCALNLMSTFLLLLLV